MFWLGLRAIVCSVQPAALNRQPYSKWVFLTPAPWRAARAMRSRGEQRVSRVSSRGGERREGVRRAGRGASFLLKQCELSTGCQASSAVEGREGETGWLWCATGWSYNL